MPHARDLQPWLAAVRCKPRRTIGQTGALYARAVPLSAWCRRLLGPRACLPNPAPPAGDVKAVDREQVHTHGQRSCREHAPDGDHASDERPQRLPPQDVYVQHKRREATLRAVARRGQAQSSTVRTRLWLP